MNEYIDELFEKDCLDKTHDLLQDYAVRGLESIYDDFALLIEYFLENIECKDFDSIVGRCFNVILKSIYNIDHSKIDNWDEFIDTLVKKGSYLGFTLNRKFVKQNYRKPPKPKFFFTVQKGCCKYCGKPIYKKDGTINRRMHWHPECVKEYLIIYDPKETRKAVFERDKGVCKNCGVVDERINGNWQMDHIIRLKESDGNIEYWKLNNIQSLCQSCHIEKSAYEIKYYRNKKNG